VDPDDAGRGDQDLFGRDADPIGGPGCHPSSVLETLLAGAGVGVAAIHHNRASLTARDALAIQDDRGGRETVLGKRRRGGAGVFRQ
jgi:hypothetical protein